MQIKSFQRQLTHVDPFRINHYPALEAEVEETMKTPKDSWLSFGVFIAQI